MDYVYILESLKDGKFYTGCTDNLRQRLLLHNTGKVASTKHRSPLEVIHYEAFINKRDAFARERWLKTGWGRNQLNKILRNYLAVKNKGKNRTAKI